MTTKQTLQAMKRAGKPICLSHLYRLFSQLNIAPLGRARPQQYPADTAERLLAHLGFSSAVPAAGIKPLGTKLISVRALRAAKHKTKGTK